MKFPEKGYTLIELIVVIAMLTGLSAVLLLNSGTSRDAIRINNAATQLESLITLAQSYGHSGKAFPEGSTNPADFDRGYGVHIVQNSSTILIYGGIGDDNFNDDDFFDPEEGAYVSGNEYQSFELEGGVEVSRISPSNAHEVDIFFKRGMSEAVLTSYSPDQNSIDNNLDEFTITLKLDVFTVDVVVNRAGLIYIEE